jgi:hypothetical protein
MMKTMNAPLAGLLALAALASGCATPYSDAPLATNFETTKQRKLQTAAHWTTIAQDVAEQLAGKVPQGSALFVSLPQQRTPFERAFAGQLTTSLIGAGYAVLKSPEGALLVEVDTQAVRFTPERPHHRYVGASALAGGVWALHEVDVLSAGGWGLLALGAGDALTWFRSEFATGATPRTEILINTSVSDANRYLARNTSVYYVAEDDHASAFNSLYAPPPAIPIKTFQVKGGEQ